MEIPGNPVIGRTSKACSIAPCSYWPSATSSAPTSTPSGRWPGPRTLATERGEIARYREPTR